MEKWFVVTAIWTMCAMCAVLFIRGATSGMTRVSGRAARDAGGHLRSGNAQTNDA
ncbi:MAG TPA: hypothetical protein VGL08_15285 [Paraburkholderia sp.]|jgi:hypothetical protein